MVDADQVGDPDEVEAEAEGVHPEQLGVLGISGRDVPGDPLIEPEPTEEAEGGGQPLLAVEPLLVDRGEHGVALREFDGHGGLLGVTPQSRHESCECSASDRQSTDADRVLFEERW